MLQSARETNLNAPKSSKPKSNLGYHTTFWWTVFNALCLQPLVLTVKWSRSLQLHGCERIVRTQYHLMDSIILQGYSCFSVWCLHGCTDSYTRYTFGGKWLNVYWASLTLWGYFLSLYISLYDVSSASTHRLAILQHSGSNRRFRASCSGSLTLLDSRHSDFPNAQ